MSKASQIFRKMKDNFITYRILLILIFMMGFWLRLDDIATVPLGLHADEAYAAYNSWSLLNYGVDTYGYHNPVYFCAWGSGMNVLNSYIMMPFIFLFGLTVRSIRTPSAILSCLSLIAFYFLIKKCTKRNVAFLSTLLLSVCPWEIVIGRNNIESSLLPYFLIFATLFFVKGIEDSTKWLYLSAVMYGLSLYSYATIWPVLPFIIALSTLYAIVNKKIKGTDKNLIMSGLVLLIMALPLLLFLLVNNGYINEINTKIISIPKLPYMRNDGISIERMPENVVYFLNLLANQQVVNMANVADVNSFGIYGLFYKWSNLFLIIGILVCLCNVCNKLKRGLYDKRMYLVIWLVMSLILGLLLVKVNIIRVVAIYPMLTFCIAYGIVYLGRKYWKPFIIIMSVLYVMGAFSFHKSYVRDYSGYVSKYYQPYAGDAIEYAMEISADGMIHVDSEMSYAKVLFYSKMPVYEFINTVKYVDYPSAYMDIDVYGKFKTFFKNEKMNNKDVYILSSIYCESLNEQEWDIEDFGQFSVVRRKL